MIGIILGILEQGFIYGIIAMGVYITYHILDFPDLTVDGCFPLGGAVATLFITNGGNGFVALIFSALAGALAGLVTGIIHVKFKVRNLLSGILTMTALYSINQRVAGQANVQLFKKETMFNGAFYHWLESFCGKFTTAVMLLVLMVGIKLLLDAYLKTKSGMLLRATGDNKQIVTSLSKDYGVMTILGLVIANSLVGLGGGIIVQQQRYFDLSMGTGTIVICLASVIIGMTAYKKIPFFNNTTAVIFGSLTYKAVVSASMNLGLKPIRTTDMQLIMAVFFFLVLVTNNFRTKEVEKC